MSNELIKKRIGQFLLLLFALYIISLLQSCSTQKRIDYHINQSGRQREKAIKLGYVPLIQENTLNASIKMELTHEYTTELPATVLNILNDSEALSTMSEEQKTKIVNRFVEVIKEVPKYISIDTTLVLYNSKGDSIGFLAMKTVNGQVNINQLYVDNETIIIRQTLYQHFMSAIGLDTWWKQALFWLLIVILGALYVYKTFMTPL